MALLELGQQYPVSTQGVAIDPNDQAAAMGAGDVVEIWYESDKDITYLNAAPCVEQILKMKEQYPDFVLHYIRFEKRSIIIQFSAAPVGATISAAPRISGAIATPALWAIALFVLAIAAIITAFIAITLTAFRGYWLTPPKPVGNALAVARNWSTNAVLPNVTITVNGKSGKTGPNGEAILFKDLLAGPHVFVGATINGYDAPTAVQQTVIKDEQIVVTIWYVPTGTPKPTTGWLNVDTTPIKGEVYIDGVSQGIAPVHVELDEGDYAISYGVIEGWETPAPDTATIVGGKPTGLIGYYKPPPSVWWHELVKWTAIGLTGAAAAAILIPRIAEAARKKGGT